MDDKLSCLCRNYFWFPRKVGEHLTTTWHFVKEHSNFDATKLPENK
jgi:hypothetical protein